VPGELDLLPRGKIPVDLLLEIGQPLLETGYLSGGGLSLLLEPVDPALKFVDRFFEFEDPRFILLTRITSF